jgi:hypothetical protein
LRATSMPAASAASITRARATDHLVQPEQPPRWVQRMRQRGGC